MRMQHRETIFFVQDAKAEMRQWGHVLGGDNTVRPLYFNGQSTPPRPPPPPPTSQYGHEGQFLRATPRDGAVRTPDGTPHWQFQHAYVTNRNSFTTPPHLTSTSWASQLATPQMSPGWYANGSSLCAPIAPYDPQVEEARLDQAVKLGTTFGTTLMQSSSGCSHTSIQAACYARQQQLQGVISRFTRRTTITTRCGTTTSSTVSRCSGTMIHSSLRSDLSSAIEQRLKAPQTVFGSSLVSIVEQPTVAGLLWNSNLGANARWHKNQQIDHTVVSSFWGLLGTVLPPQKGNMQANRLWTGAQATSSEHSQKGFARPGAHTPTMYCSAGRWE